MTPPAVASGAAAPSSASMRGVFDRQLVRLSVVVSLGTLMSIVDTTIVNVAIPTLGRDLHASLATIQWTTTSYLLALALVIPLTRWVIERVGAKRAYVASLALFVVGSVLCGVAWSAPSLILFRAIEGIGGGMLVPVGQTILTRSAGPERMGRVMSIVGAPPMLGIVIGPVLGGLILVTLGWRWIFYVNVPIGILALVLCGPFLPGDAERSRPSLDVWGLALLPPGLALLLFGFTELGNVGRLTTSALVCLVAGPVLVLVFVGRSFVVRAPLLNLRLFGVRRYTTANVAAFVFTAASGSGPLVTTLYFQVGRGYSAFGSGLYQASLALGAIAAMPLAGRATDRSGPRRVALLGMALATASNVPWLFLTPTTPMALLAASLALRGLGVGCVITPLMAAGYAALGREAMPTATTLSNICQRVGQTVGVALLAIVLQDAMIADLPRRFSSLGAIPTVPAERRALLAPLAHAFVHTSDALMVLFVFSFLGALLLPRTRPAAPPEISSQPVPEVDLAVLPVPD